MTRQNTDQTLLKLMSWLSPSFPVGAYSYSHGLEWAVEHEDVRELQKVQAWLAGVFEHGSGRTDGILFCHAFDAIIEGDEDRLGRVAELATAMNPSKERMLESTAQGRAFFEICSTVWPSPAFNVLKNVHAGPFAYPIVVAVAAAGQNLDKRSALLAYLHAFVANLVSAAVRLIPLGQTDGQRLMMAFEDTITTVADAVLESTLDSLGSMCLMADMASLQHETQYTRLFRS